MIIKFQKLFEDTNLPSYAHPGDAGMDLRSHEEKTLEPFERYCFKIGLAVEIPDGFVGLVWDRSGLSLKEGVKTLGGVIDSGYRGEIGVTLVNISNTNIKIEKDDRIAQLLIQPVEICEIREVKKLSDSARGEGGFGASGKK